jgi:carbamoyltransferase
MAARLVLGLNQYTHSAAACLLDEEGRVLGALAKERVTRRKHDGGDAAAVVDALLETTGHALEEIGLVVANNHLFRIRAFEQHLDFACALHQQPPSAQRASNLFPGVPKHELSHHLAHAWSVLPFAPFDEGLILVADGIGTTRADLERASVGSELGSYTSDIDLPASPRFRQFPAEAPPHSTAREGETVYQFRGLHLERLWKRWIQERTPVFLYNYGFENMESLGAVYSRVSSQIFGDWNACGKVMGLAPWKQAWAGTASASRLMQGPLEQLQVDWPTLLTAEHTAAWSAAQAGDEKLRAGYTELAAQVQDDLEEILLEFLTRLRRETGARNLCMAGGVALNSTANGRIAREAGFEQVFIPPWPGDEGIAVGCAWFGHHQQQPTSEAPRRCFAPYQGGAATPDSIEEALETYGPWLEIESLDSAGICPAVQEQDEAWLQNATGRIGFAADAIEAGETVGWFQGRSEFGPRALGNRSILASPAQADMVERINTAIKKREGFRPFAPTVLAAHAAEWFPLVTPSPAMSLTVPVAADKAAQIPAVVHVDGSARIQTLEPEANPLYHALIEACSSRTGLPMVLNTSFNVKGEPIVETPSDALRHFLDSDLDCVVLEWIGARKLPFPSGAELAESVPQQLSSFTAEVVSDAQGEAIAVSLLAHGDNFEAGQLELGILEACLGEASVAELEAEFASEFEVEPEEFEAALARLYGWRLLWFV